MNTLLILPTQLFEVDFINKLNIDIIYIIEHPYYFTRYNFHKLKLAFLVASSLNYYAYLKENLKNVTIKYIKYNELYKINNTINNNFLLFDPIDRGITFDNIEVIIIDTPAFLLTTYDINKIKYKRLSAFYNNVKRILLEKNNIDYTNLKNLDNMNRNRIPTEYLNKLKEETPTYKNKYYKKALNYINKNFNDNFGDLTIEALQELPVTHNDAIKHLEFFIKKKIRNFGPYQDFISKDHIRLFHSNISHLINVGLLTPLQVIKEVNKVRNIIPPESFEGFIRQIIGWREYMRYIYIKNPELQKDNFWKSNKSLDWNSFYGNKSTGITFIDNEIQKIKKTAWSHHIIRLMIFLNYFVLTGINPNDILRWFLETIALDSYDWVMVSNIWTMGYFTKEYTSKPYFSSGNYIKKMSNYTNKEDFSKFDKLYKDFLKKNKNLKFYRF